MFIDANYFLRFLLNDIPEQQKEVKNLFLDASEGKVRLVTSTIVFFEVYWVLFSVYKHTKGELVEALHKLLKLRFITLEEQGILGDSLSLFEKTTLDLEDCYNLYYAKSKKVHQFKTFDKKLEKEFSRQ